MTGWRKRQVQDMAREAGLLPCQGIHPKDLEAFEALVRADEREACAKVCDELIAPDVYSDTDKSMWDVTCIDCAAAIRARGQE